MSKIICNQYNRPGRVLRDQADYVEQDNLKSVLLKCTMQKARAAFGKGNDEQLYLLPKPAAVTEDNDTDDADKKSGEEKSSKKVETADGEVENIPSDTDSFESRISTEKDHECPSKQR